MERRRYRNPPIEEALCELRFVPGPEADSTAPARFYERAKSSYSGKPQTQPFVAAHLQFEPQTAGSQMAMRQEGVKVLFPDAQGRRLVGLGKHLLSVHVLRPYPGWQEFRCRIEEALKAYQEADPPTGVQRIAVRYINRIEIQNEVVD